MVNIERILCPVDLSVFSRDALHHALALARWYEAQVTVFHVYSAPQSVVPVTGTPGNLPLPPLVQPARSLKNCAGSALLHSHNRGSLSTSS